VGGSERAVASHYDGHPWDGHFRKNDDPTWEELLSDRGPIGTFSAKILAGYAFGIYDESIRKNLDVVRQIRNGFAHSKTMIDFNHELVVRELAKLVVPKKASKDHKQTVRDIKTGADYPWDAFTILCMSMSTELLNVGTRTKLAKVRRLRRRVAAKADQSPFYGALNAAWLARGGPPTNWLKWLQDHQSAGPSSEVPRASSSNPLQSGYMANYLRDDGDGS
jgi:hypothetical protein